MNPPVSGVQGERNTPSVQPSVGPSSDVSIHSSPNTSPDSLPDSYGDPPIVRAQPGPPLGTDRRRERQHGRIAGAIGRDAAGRLPRLRQALGPAAGLLSPDDIAGLRLVADWDACFLDGVAIDDMRAWRRLIDAGRLPDVQGAFAVAWIDGHGRLCLARDAIGHRGLFYSSLPDGLVFASTIHAVLRALSETPQLHLPALPRYLSCAYVPGRDTLARGIHKLLPGEIVVCDGNRLQSSFFVRLPQEPAAADLPDEEALRQRLRSTLDQTLHDLLPTDEDQPVGATLSGGIDSSLVVALAQRQRRRRLQTFALSFGPEYKNELPFSSLLAQHCGTQHRIIELSPQVVLRHLDEAIALLGDPNGDPLTVPNALCFREASQHVGVVLNGEGGDPCFGGPKNVPMLLAELLGDGGFPSESVAKSRAQSYLRAHQKCYEELADLVLPDVLAACQTQDLEDEVALQLADARGSSFLGRLMALNVQWKGAHHILPKVDELSAPFGVVPRSPLFDRRVVALASQIPATYKLRGSVEKYLLKQAVADVVPQAICDRPKSGMLVPVEGWFSGPLLPYARERLLDGLRPYGLFRADYLERLVAGKLPGLRPRRGVKIWLLLTLEAWLRQVLRADVSHPASDRVGDRMIRMADAAKPTTDAQVLKRAIQLADRERDQKDALQQQQVLTEAAAELGVPAHLVEQAAAQLAQERQKALATRRKALLVGAGATAGLLALLVGSRLLQPSPPVAYSMAAASGHWSLNKNAATQASLRLESVDGQEAAVVRVERFVAEGSEGKFHVNLDASDALPAVEKYRSVVFRSRGQGLDQLRLFLEVSPNERWRSPPISLSSQWVEHRLPLSLFEHQMRSGEAWQRAAASDPHGVQRLSFKLGHFMNDVNAHGEAVVSGLRFE